MFLWTSWMHFRQTRRKFFDESPKIVAQYPKMIKKNDVFSKRLFFLRLIHWTRRLQFLTTQPKFCDKKPKISRSMSDENEKLKFFSIIFFLKLFRWTTMLQFWQPCDSFFHQRPKSSSLNVRKWWKNKHIFSEDLFFVKKFSWTRQMQLWQPCRKKILPEGRRVFAHFPTNLIEVFVIKNKEFFRKNLIWTRKMRFCQPCRNIFHKRPKTFGSITENDSKEFAVCRRIQVKYKKLLKYKRNYNIVFFKEKVLLSVATNSFLKGLFWNYIKILRK